MNQKHISQLVLFLVLYGLIFGCSRIPTPITPKLPTIDTPTFTPTMTFTNTPINTSTGSPTPTATQTYTKTTTSTNTMTSTSTITPSSPTATPSPTMSYTPANTATSIATALDTAPAFNLSSGVTTLTTGIYYFSCVHISAGAVVTIAGSVTIITECFTLDAGTTITGVGEGYSPPGAICPSSTYGGGPGTGGDAGNGFCGALCDGGGHGGKGGYFCFYDVGDAVSCCTNPGGAANDDPIHPSQMGSAGGWPMDATSSCTQGEDYGGGLLQVVVYNPTTNNLQPATINGTIDMSGSNTIVFGMDMEPGGAGAGGTILVEASTTTGSGTLMANGGNGGGAGGGGGIISMICDTTSFTGTTSVNGGANNAQNGIVSKTAPPSSGY